MRDIYYGLPYINGSHSYTSNTRIYAPATVGTAGQILQSDGSGAPIWVDASSIGGGGGGDTTGTTSASLTISLNGSSSSFNGSVARSYSFYAPLGGGISGRLLKSNGSTSAPTWVDVKLYQHNIIVTSSTNGATCTILNNSSSAIDTEAELKQWLTNLGADDY